MRGGFMTQCNIYNEKERGSFIGLISDKEINQGSYLDTLKDGFEVSIEETADWVLRVFYEYTLYGDMIIDQVLKDIDYLMSSNNITQYNNKKYIEKTREIMVRLFSKYELSDILD